ncbi:hypothetical protein [Sphaerisporangium fuscum]|uniref:hypothetical protein n=1 Tax=Sphaerisporangium fuscum TaxID=2835868 RepID=UPI001BDC72C5|nr:hypothetical protein [Sphaerisporangium fuscum]
MPEGTELEALPDALFYEIAELIPIRSVIDFGGRSMTFFRKVNGYIEWLIGSGNLLKIEYSGDPTRLPTGEPVPPIWKENGVDVATAVEGIRSGDFVRRNTPMSVEEKIRVYDKAIWTLIRATPEERTDLPLDCAFMDAQRQALAAAQYDDDDLALRQNLYDYVSHCLKEMKLVYRDEDWHVWPEQDVDETIADWASGKIQYDAQQVPESV